MSSSRSTHVYSHRPAGLDTFERYQLGAVDLAEERPASELLAVQHKLAEMALGQDDPAEWLQEVLEALGLNRVIKVPPYEGKPLCWPHSGLKRGLRTHLRLYDRPCSECRGVQDEIRRAKLEELGITHDGVVQ